jgi:hypothetical protein
MQALGKGGPETFLLQRPVSSVNKTWHTQRSPTQKTQDYGGSNKAMCTQNRMVQGSGCARCSSSARRGPGSPLQQQRKMHFSDGPFLEWNDFGFQCHPPTTCNSTLHFIIKNNLQVPSAHSPARPLILRGITHSTNPPFLPIFHARSPPARHPVPHPTPTRVTIAARQVPSTAAAIINTHEAVRCPLRCSSGRIYTISVLWRPAARAVLGIPREVRGGACGSEDLRPFSVVLRQSQFSNEVNGVSN